MATPDCAAVVVGAGLAGLAAALELEKTQADVVLLDASDRPGGVLRTDHVSGYVVERGPNTFLLKPELHAALVERALESFVVRAQPASRRRYIWRGGELQPVPMSPWGFVRTPLLTAGGKLRLLSEPFRRRRDGASESVAEFTTRRFGAQVLESMVGPFLTGVYAGDESQLGAEAVFGRLVEFEKRWGSVALGGLVALLTRRGERGLPGTWSAPEGLGPFARRLAACLSDPPALGTRVVSLRREAGAWHLELESPGGATALRAQRVVLAGAARESAALLAEVEPRCAELLSGIRYAPVVSLPLGVEASGLARPADGFGFLVPRTESASLLGCLFMSQLFPGRAPEGHELLQCMLGGTRWPEALEAPDEVLVERAAGDLDRVLGLRATPQALGCVRWQAAIPQPDRDHVSRMAEARARLQALPGLALAGGYLDGVAVPDAFASGRRAARELAAPV